MHLRFPLFPTELIKLEHQQDVELAIDCFFYQQACILHHSEHQDMLHHNPPQYQQEQEPDLGGLLEENIHDVFPSWIPYCVEVDPGKKIPLGRILGNDPSCCAGAGNAGMDTGKYLCM